MKKTKIALVITLVLILMLLSALITWEIAFHTLEPILLGDVNKDRKIDDIDLKLVQNHLLEISKLSRDEVLRADMDLDGEITVFDLLRIQKYIIGGS